jgi:hypothetical protein
MQLSRLARRVWLQVGFLPHFLSVLHEVSADPNNPLHGKIDFTNLGAAGHSRGAKIAAMHFAGRWRAHWAMLLDTIQHEGGGRGCMCSSERDTGSVADRCSLYVTQVQLPTD